MGLPNRGDEATGGPVPNENFVQPTSHAISRDEPQSRSSLSLLNEIRRCVGVQGSTVWTVISDPRRGSAQPGRIGFSGSPSFVAVMQSTDLR